MKSTIVMAIALTGLILSACNSKKDSKGNNDTKTQPATASASGVNPQIEAELKKVIKMVKDGFVPGIAEIKSIDQFDKDATSFEMNGKATGNFHTIIDNDEVNIEKFYSTNYMKPDILYEIRFNPSDKTLGEGNLDMNAYVPIIDKELGVKGAKGTKTGFEDYMVWQTDKYYVFGNASLSSFLLHFRKELH